jgi:dihydroorotate dehydrogenase electron transfer subunit
MKKNDLSRIANIRKRRWFTDNVFGLECYLPGINPRPGQFFQVRIGEGYDPFLNRPISIASYVRGKLLLVVKILGRGTKILSEKREGDDLTLLGPFGTGVRPVRKKSLLIAGGIGTAPLYFLAQDLYRRRVSFTFLYGTKTPADIILKNNIIKISNEAIFVTERGSQTRQTAVGAVREIDTSEYGAAYACGPRDMLRELQSLRLPMPVYAFCEDFLGCGCGLCLGCAIKYRGVYKRVCEDGPVFELEGIEFES